MDFNLDREWIDSDTEEVAVAPEDETTVILTAHPDETIPDERYALEFQGEDEEGNAIVDKVYLQVRNPDASFFSRYLWHIIGAIILLILLMNYYVCNVVFWIIFSHSHFGLMDNFPYFRYYQLL